MPKQTIQWPKTVPTDNPNVFGADGTTVSVIWMRNGHVQLALENNRPGDEPCAEGVELFSDPMTRVEINNFIRTLRKARDQVFGGDE